MTQHVSQEQHSTPSVSGNTVPVIVRAQPIGPQARTGGGHGSTTSSPGARPAATGQPGYSVTMNAVPEAVEEARRLVRQAVCAWGFEGQSETAALLISELVTNAITHTPSRSVRVVVTRPSPSLVRLAVVDRAPGLVPDMRPVSTEAESGRGLRLIDALADRWGYDLLGSHPMRGPWGKRCWAELRVAGEGRAVGGAGVAP
jgi:serine/threonine-protein kinase RsbW